MRFSEVAARAAKESGFLSEIQAVANRAAVDGIGSEAWIELMGYFAENDYELSLLIPDVNGVPGQLDTTTNTTNTLTTQTGMTGTTTTTTTTSRLCTLPGICPRAEAAPDGGRQAGARKQEAGARKSGGKKRR